MKIITRKIELFVKVAIIKKRKNGYNTLPTNRINTSYQQPDIENVNNKVSKFENHRHVVIGPSNVGKTYYMLKILEKIGN